MIKVISILLSIMYYTLLWSATSVYCTLLTPSLGSQPQTTSWKNIRPPECHWKDGFFQIFIIYWALAGFELIIHIYLESISDLFKQLKILSKSSLNFIHCSNSQHGRTLSHNYIYYNNYLYFIFDLLSKRWVSTNFWSACYSFYVGI